MNSRRPSLPLLALGLLSSVLFPPTLVAADAPNPAEARRIADRYALTKARIGALLDQRQHPTPLPANPPNPFYQAPKEVAGDPTAGHESPDTAPVPEAADLSDSDTLRKYASTLKLGGVITRNGVLHLAINNTASKVGDAITVGPRDRPVYLRIAGLTTTELTLALNDATLTVPLRK
ncbi:MAG: hypothetical protein HYX71_10370 [Opitutae bacterium]|nr:hypothetical protein [Opitutae bacterium]